MLSPSHRMTSSSYPTKQQQQQQHHQQHQVQECQLCRRPDNLVFLPSCLHTLCVTCITDWVDQSKLPALEIACPLCGTASELRRNHAISMLIERKTEERRSFPASNAASERSFGLDDRPNSVRNGTGEQDFLGGRIHLHRKLLKSLDHRKVEFIAEIGRIEEGIRVTADRIKRLVDQHTEELVDELMCIKQATIKDVESAKQELEKNLSELNSVRDGRFDERDGMMGPGVRSRVDELLEFDPVKHAKLSLKGRRVGFRSNLSTFEESASNIVGRVVVTEQSKDDEVSQSAPVASVILKYVIPPGEYVSGVTSLGDQVFVARLNCRDIEVYDVTTMTQLTRLPVPGLSSQPWGLAGCADNTCIYVSDNGNSCVHRIQMEANGVSASRIDRWTVAKRPAALSVNDASNVLVVSQTECKIQEYTTRGQLVREIGLEAARVERPWQAVQLNDDGLMVVSHDGRNSHGVVLVGRDGRVVSGLGGSEADSVSRARGLAVSRRNAVVLLVDKDNNRIVVLDQSLTGWRQLKLPAEGGGLNGPIAISFDESRDRLYVAEWNGKRVLVFDNVGANLRTAS